MIRWVYEVRGADGSARAHTSALDALAEVETWPELGLELHLVGESTPLPDGAHRIDVDGVTGEVEIVSGVARARFAARVDPREVARELRAMTGRAWSSLACDPTRTATFYALAERTIEVTP